MAEMNLNPREKARLEEEKKNRKTRNKFILVGVIVVLMIALVIFVNSRLFYNVTTALTIGDTNYSVARMNYEYQKAYMNFNQTYGQYFGSLIDTSKSLKEQSCPFDANGGTWDDYFKQSAETNLTQLSAVYAKAIAEGYAGTISQNPAVQAYLTLRLLRNSLDGVDINTGISKADDAGNVLAEDDYKYSEEDRSYYAMNLAVTAEYADKFADATALYDGAQAQLDSSKSPEKKVWLDIYNAADNFLSATYQPLLQKYDKLLNLKVDYIAGDGQTESNITNRLGNPGEYDAFAINMVKTDNGSSYTSLLA